MYPPPPPPRNSCLFSESTIDTIRCCVCILYFVFIHNITCCSWLDGWGRRQGRDPEGNGQPGFSISPPDPNQFFFVPAIIYCHLFIVHPKRYVKAFKKLSITLAVATSPCIAYGIEKCMAWKDWIAEDRGLVCKPLITHALAIFTLFALRFHLHNNIPYARGFGSSSAGLWEEGSGFGFE